jgi:hypothetical protein
MSLDDNIDLQNLFVRVTIILLKSPWVPSRSEHPEHSTPAIHAQKKTNESTCLSTSHNAVNRSKVHSPSEPVPTVHHARHTHETAQVTGQVYINHHTCCVWTAIISSTPLSEVLATIRFVTYRSIRLSPCLIGKASKTHSTSPSAYV